MPKKNTTPGHLYDDIKTAKELVQEVMAHGISTDVNDICRAQGIFGHSSIEDLVALANDDAQAANKRGVNHGYQSTFYSILFHIWDWERATGFYNEHTNPVFKHHKEMIEKWRQEASTATQRLNQVEKQRDLLKTDTEQMHTQIIELEQRAGEAETKLAAAEQTILELKAKLWDLTMGGEK